MDDLCLGLTAATPQLLISKAGLTTALLLETLEGYGMTPNLTKGKTELLLSPCGGRVCVDASNSFLGHNPVALCPLYVNLVSNTLVSSDSINT